MRSLFQRVIDEVGVVMAYEGCRKRKTNGNLRISVPLSSL